MTVPDRIDYSRYADLYDAYVRLDVDISFYLQRARAVAQQAGGGVLELMSGTGRVSIPLLKAGIRLTCVDASPDMLTRLREKVQRNGLAAEIYEMDICRLKLPGSYPLVIIPFHAFSELLDEQDQRRALEGIRNHLAPGGRLILTLHNPTVRLQRMDGLLRLWADVPLDGVQENGAGSRLLVFGMETYDMVTAIVDGRQFFELYDGRGVLQSKRMVPFHFRIMTRQEMETRAAACGLYPAALYGNYDGAQYDEKNSPFLIWDFRADGE